MKLEQLRQELQYALDHFVGLGNVVKDSYQKLYPSEKGLMVYSLLVAGRRLAMLMKEVQRWQEKFIPNVTDVDLVEARKDIYGVMGYLPQCNCDMQIGYAMSKYSKPIFDSDEIVNEENLSQFFPPKEQNSDYNNARQLMISESVRNYEELEQAIDDVTSCIDQILNDEKKLKRDDIIRLKRLKSMETFYMSHYWEQDKNMLIARAKGELEDKENKDKSAVYILGLLIRDINADTLNDNNEILTMINLHRSDAEYVADMASEHRNIISVDDMMSHFKFRESCKLLQNHIDSIFLLDKCEKYDGKLFVNEASYEFAQLIKDAVDLYVGSKPVLNFSFLYAALKDLGLIRPNESNATLMVEFIRDVYEEEISPDTIYKPLRKCNGTAFCMIDENNLRSFTDKEFKKYKEPYWLCYSIINKVLDIKDVECAEYLKQLHPTIASKDVFEYLEEEDKSKLYFLSSVLRGDTLMF